MRPSRERSNRPTSRTRVTLIEAGVWTTVTILVAAEILDQIRATTRRLSDWSNAWLTLVERRERRDLRRSQLAALAVEIERRRAAEKRRQTK